MSTRLSCMIVNNHFIKNVMPSKSERKSAKIVLVKFSLIIFPFLVQCTWIDVFSVKSLREIIYLFFSVLFLCVAACCSWSIKLHIGYRSVHAMQRKTSWKAPCQTRCTRAYKNSLNFETIHFKFYFSGVICSKMLQQLTGSNVHEVTSYHKLHNCISRFYRCILL